MRHAADIRGAVLEVGDRGYTQRFGAGRVTTSDILDVDADNAAATYVADLRDATSIPSDTFDCFILTQVLVLIRETHEALREIFRILKPGGVALITVPGISQISSDPRRSRWLELVLLSGDATLAALEGQFRTGHDDGGGFRQSANHRSLLGRACPN